jgi:ribosomal protein S18 acetylase RimI-like enzyme
MTTGDAEIGRATADDIASILELQERNLRKNGGALSVPMTRDWLATAIERMPIIVARRGGQVVGYVVSSSLDDQSSDPILDGMLQAHPGSPDAYIYGPICVAASERGKGMARAMVQALRAQLPGREGFTFIRTDNAVSRKVHAGMGMREAATFTVADVAYVVVAYVG